MEHGDSREPAPSSAQLGQVLEILSHDLRAPARHVKSFGQMLAIHLGTEIDDETREFLRLIDTAADRLDAMLDSLTRLATVATAALEPASWPVSTLLQDTLTQLDFGPDDKATIDDVDPAATVIADRALLGAVLAELLANSRTFCEPLSVKVTARVEDDRCLVTVADLGPGFSAKDPSKAFDIFSQFHDSIHPGAGIGLTIARTILERHGSSIHISSHPETGTAVSFWLPVGMPE